MRRNKFRKNKSKINQNVMDNLPRKEDRTPYGLISMTGRKKKKNPMRYQNCKNEEIKN